MPTYEYECEDCGHVFEKFQGMSDDPLKDCPECSGGVRRIIHGGAGLVFKGGGFYITDSRKRGSASSGNGKDSPPCKGAGESGCESCPAANN